MKPSFREELGTMLPEQIVFPYFAEREGPWLLSRRLDGATRIADLRRGPHASLLARPGMREVIAACGDGEVTPRRLMPLADPLAAFGREHELMGDRATEAAFDVATAADWLNLTLSFENWPIRTWRDDWRNLQLSRKGGNLVLQLNFPESYRWEFFRVFGAEARDWFEWHRHPVRNQGPITMAWARLDLDPWGEDLLIEELQSDWFRGMRMSRKHAISGGSLADRRRRSMFIDATLERYGRIWSRALMLAVLVFAQRELDVARAWLHQPRTGAKLKHIWGALPPRSLYSDLPKRFGFRETDRAPEFLYRARSQVLARLRRSGQPLFWRFDFAKAA